MSESHQKLSPPVTVGPGTLTIRPELHSLKIIGVEEHAVFPSLLECVPADCFAVQKTGSLGEHPLMAYIRGRITDVGDQRIKDMNDGQIAIQILSLAGTVNSTHLANEAGVGLARDINNALKKAVDANPTRFRAFAELPMNSPHEAAEELRRCVKELGFVGAMMSGSIGSSGKFLDRPEFKPVLSALEELDVPIYLHPGIPPEAVWNTYYAFPDKPALSAAFALPGWGWHNEVAIHTLRLALSGTLDKHPKLKVIIGHQGEMMPMMMQRFDTMFPSNEYSFQRSVGEMLRSQVWIAISGVFSIPPTQAAIATWGVDKVLFANDYPFIDSQRVPDYIKAVGDVIAPADLKKICQENAEKLFRFKA